MDNFDRVRFLEIVKVTKGKNDRYFISARFPQTYQRFMFLLSGGIVYGVSGDETSELTPSTQAIIRAKLDKFYLHAGAEYI